jgi:aromatic-L-amino-acid/L-tryptophan decarboxylase
MESQEFREAGHRLIDLLAEYLDTAETRPLFPRQGPGEIKRLFEEPLPEEPSPLGSVLDAVETRLLPNATQLSHPGYFGLITPSPLPAGILGDLIASALNQNPGAYSIGPAATAMERQTVRWLTDLAGFGPEAGGNLTSGGTMANFIGLKLARDAVTKDQAQHEGLRGEWAAYTSEERHVSVDKAADAVGLGRERLRVIPTDDRFEIQVEALDASMAKDKREGIRPLCIIAMGGSTNTGAVDPLATLRRIADREGAWLHVDAAYGGGMLLSREHPGLLDGLGAADSVTLDPHKWFYAPLDAGAILVRDAGRLTQSFGMQPAYLTDPVDAGRERYDFYVHGFEQSRRFRALKVWMAMKRYGTREIGRWIDANVAQANRLHDLARAHPDFVSAVPPRMSAVCIRYAPKGLEEGASARLHAAVARKVEEGGRFWISTTVLKGRTWFRVNPVNIRTRVEHLEELFRLLTDLCAKERATGKE